MTELPMPHQVDARGKRRKTRKEIAEMLSQYQSQLETIKDETARQLVLREISRLQQLLAGKGEDQPL